MNKHIRIPIILLVMSVIQVLRLVGIPILSLSSGDWFFFIFSVVSIAADLALCFVLFANKRDNTLIMALGFRVLLKLIYLFVDLNVWSILGFSAHGLLLVFALAVCEQTLVKTDLTRIKEFASDYYYLPALLYLVASAYSILGLFGNIYSLLAAVTNALNVVVFFLFGKWFKDLYEESVFG